MNERLDSSGKEKVSARREAIIELNSFYSFTSPAENSFKPLCLSVGAIHSLEPYCSNKYHPGVKAVLFLRKNQHHVETVKVRESYDEVKALIRAAQRTGFATLADL